MSVNYEQLGDRIRRIRKEKKITQEALGKQIGLTSVQIFNIETAKSRPSVDSLINISNIFQISVDELLFGSVHHIEDPFCKEFCEIIDDCNENEKHIIIESARSLRNLLKEYDKTGS